MCKDTMYVFPCGHREQEHTPCKRVTGTAGRRCTADTMDYRFEYRYVDWYSERNCLSCGEWGPGLLLPLRTPFFRIVGRSRMRIDRWEHWG